MAEQTERWSSVKRFFKMLELDKKDITYVYIYAIFSGLITLSVPLGIQAIIGLIVGGSLSTALLVLITIVTIGTMLTGILKIMQITVTETLQRRIFARSAFEFAYRIPRFKLEKMLGDYPPELVNRFFDTLTLQKGVPKLLMDFSTAGLQIIFGLLLISFYHPFFVFFGVILLLILVLILRITGPGGLKTSLNESKYKYKVVYWLEEMARALTTFKMAGRDNFYLRQTDELVSAYLDNRKKHFRILLIQYGNIVGFKTIITLALLLLGSTLVIQNRINIGQFVAAEIVVLLIMSSVEKLILSMETIYDVLTAVEKIGGVVDLPLDREEGLEYQAIRSDEGISIKAEKVSYQYSDAEKPNLREIDLDIPAGSSLCLSGYNGSGKATLTQLLTGMYNQFKGQINFNEIPLMNMNLNSFRRNIGTYSELSDIFRGTVIDNICLGHEGLDVHDILKAADEVGLKKFIQRLPEGLQTMLLPGGRNIPRGIRTKILIARAIVHKPKLLVLEEFFSKLEVVDQLKIARFITDKKWGWTLVLISNNPNIAAFCDQVAILKDGLIVEKGTFQDILQSDHYQGVFMSGQFNSNINPK